MPNRAYVIAVLGNSPAVLTELLWSLIATDQVDVLGLEVWTTEGGIEALRSALKTRAWDDLEKALSADGERLPRWTRVLKPLAPADAPAVTNLESNGRRARAIFFEEQGQPLSDVRTPEDAYEVAAQIHDRVRGLVAELPRGVQLIGSLAGGRKTMSAALQSAFSLHARIEDRLVHVLLHSEIERTEHADRFVAPTVEIEAALGIPLYAQVTVYDVPFAPLRELLAGDRISTAREISALSYGETLGRIRSVHRAPVRAVLRDGDGGRWPWKLHIEPASLQIPPIDLSERMAQIYAAIASLGRDGGDDEAIWNVLRDAGAVYLTGKNRTDRPLGPWSEDERDYMKKMVSDTKARLQRLSAYGLRELLPQSSGRGPVKRSIPASARVEGVERVTRSAPSRPLVTVKRRVLPRVSCHSPPGEEVMPMAKHVAMAVLKAALMAFAAELAKQLAKKLK